MKQKIINLGLFVGLFYAAQAIAQEPLYIESNLEDSILSESAVEIIQCISSKREGTWELVEHILPTHRLSLKFSEVDSTLLIKAKNQSETRWIKQNHCEELTLFLGLKKAEITIQSLAPPSIPKSAELTDLDNIEDTTFKKKTFLAKNWPFFAAAGVLVSGILVYKKLSQQEPAPPQRQVNVQIR
jgi:hypothetical protein